MKTTEGGLSKYASAKKTVQFGAICCGGDSVGSQPWGIAFYNEGFRSNLNLEIGSSEKKKKFSVKNGEQGRSRGGGERRPEG